MKEKYAKLLVNLLLWAAGIVLLFTVVPRLLLFFLPLVIGWILAILANPLVRLMEKRFRIVRRHGSMLIIITAIAPPDWAGRSWASFMRFRRPMPGWGRSLPRSAKI